MSIGPPRLGRQAWKFWFCLVSWPLYLLVIPWLFHLWGWWSLLFMIFPGVWLFTWVGLLMHEAWHRYVPGLPHHFFYYAFGFMLLTDPQIYRLVHGSHHADVNSWDDAEFHPLGRISRDGLRRVYNLLEILLGNIFWNLVATLTVPTLPRYRSRYRRWLTLTSFVVWIMFLGGLASASLTIFPVTLAELAVSFFISYYLGAVILHHSQLIQHGNLIGAGDWRSRAMLTRNLKNDGFCERFFNFLTHNDSREHILHHTKVAVYTRPFPGRLPLPGGAVFISLGDYLKILWGMVSRQA
jgi:fatty acid desaturase